MPDPVLVDFLREEIVPALPGGEWKWGKKTVELDIAYGDHGHIRVLAVESEGYISLSFARLETDEELSVAKGAAIKKPHVFFHANFKNWSEFESRKAEILEKVQAIASPPDPSSSS